jgi:signal recognition particle subunit SRP54
MREVRRALIEADVALEVVRGFTDRVREKAVGAESSSRSRRARWSSRSSMTSWSRCWAQGREPIDLKAAAAGRRS